MDVVVSLPFVPTIEHCEELCIRVFLIVSFFVPHAKSGTTNNHWNGSSDISYKSLFSRDLNDIL